MAKGFTDARHAEERSVAQQDGDRRNHASLLRALGWVSVFFSDVAGFAFLGWLIDHYGRTKPWGIAGGGFLGLCLGLYHLSRALTPTGKR
jgi:F0F1-type ATP synthase assembly protein I